VSIMNLKEKMKKLDNLANAVQNAPNPGMKQIWSDKWNALIKQYVKEFESMTISKPDPYNEHLNKTKGER